MGLRFGLLVWLLCPAARALAQVAESVTPSAAEDTDVEAMVVTGSRIKRSAELASSAPVDILDHKTLERTGVAYAGDLLQALTSAQGSGFQGAGNPNNQGGGARGTVTVNLRGLGAGSTLVLLNGRRLTPTAGGTDETLGDLAFQDLDALDRGQWDHARATIASLGQEFHHRSTSRECTRLRNEPIADIAILRRCALDIPVRGRAGNVVQSDGKWTRLSGASVCVCHTPDFGSLSPLDALLSNMCLQVRAITKVMSKQQGLPILWPWIHHNLRNAFYEIFHDDERVFYVPRHNK